MVRCAATNPGILRKSSAKPTTISRMPRPRNHVPTYRLHKQSGQAIVTINHNGTRRDVLLGRYGTPESRPEYQRVLAELNASAPAAVVARAPGYDLTLNEVLVAFMQHAVTYYRT